MELLEIYTLVICEIRVHNIQCSFEYIIQSGDECHLKHCECLWKYMTTNSVTFLFVVNRLYVK